MAVTSANKATRELHFALAHAALRGKVTNFHSETGDGYVHTMVYMPTPDAEGLLTQVIQTCTEAFPDILDHYIFRPGGLPNRGANRSTKLGFAFTRPLPGYVVCDPVCVCCPHHPDERPAREE